MVDPGTQKSRRASAPSNSSAVSVGNGVEQLLREGAATRRTLGQLLDISGLRRRWPCTFAGPADHGLGSRHAAEQPGDWRSFLGSALGIDPMTVPGDPDGALIVWDNSNIQESYAASPLR